MRKRLIALGATVALLAPAGCSNEQPDPAPLPPVRIAEQPAASAGGACILWDYPFIEKTIGVAFSVAASDQVDETSTCVVQTTSAQGPYLALSVVESTKADADLFLDEMMPAKSTKVKGLGKAGYRLVAKASGGHGPTIEISWLSEAEQLQTLRYTFAKGASAKDVERMQTKLLSLAKAINTTNG
ncbi:hypothetical protein [Couchioplanes caeruleus]|uniref:DUF3558 domain-containing protein n=2 Tax=Couchioplanes caeruleus TaxID=56438 RepID=A0A1K0G0T4_9ACTN|nr:hypothetical protein [Couchioplanes caeruleus]OJF10914.1 hypothetical protein BG844_29465 [Couchioplanes caeruleus subsp. caeruleus]ROP32654.1 hypothetical protein EDD30_5600 [Couchioplanes caeruleus]